MYRKNPEAIQDEIQAVIDEKGESLELGSQNLTGYGLAMTRDGMYINANQKIDTQRSLWMFYGSNAGHGHQDKLNLGIIAYGLDMAPDMDNPDYKTIQGNRSTWVESPMSHNSVFVVEKKGVNYKANVQNESLVGTPYHFDDSGKVKVIDVIRRKPMIQQKSSAEQLLMLK